MKNSTTLARKPNRIKVLLTVAMWCATVGYLMYHWSQLTGPVPIHFDAAGQPDSYGDKSSIYILVLIGIAATVLVAWLSHKPQWANLPYKLAAEHKPLAYQELTTTLLIVNILITALLCFMTISIINITLGFWSATPMVIVYVLLAMIVCLLLVKTFTLRKYKSNGQT